MGSKAYNESGWRKNKRTSFYDISYADSFDAMPTQIKIDFNELQGRRDGGQIVSRGNLRADYFKQHDPIFKEYA